MSRFAPKFEDGLKGYDNATEEAIEDLHKMGLGVATRPEDEEGEFADRPVLPPDLSALTFVQTQKLMGQFSAWYDYAVGQLKVAEVRRNGADEKKGFAWSAIRKLKEGTVDDKNDDTRTDSRFMDVNSQYHYCDSLVRMLQGIVEGLKRDIETISRAATIMADRQGVGGRAVSVERKGRNRSDVLTKFRTGRRQR